MIELTKSLGWAEQGSRVFLEQLEGLADNDFTAESRLPNWTRAHVVGHVGFNARGLVRLVHWARTGEKTPMYASRQARNDEIEEGAHLPPAALRALAVESDRVLRAEMAQLSESDGNVSTALGVPVPATEIPWMRTREVWIHAVDLGTGVEFADFPADLVDALITDIAGARATGEGPAVVLRPDDREREWRIGENGDVVRGKAADLAAWLAGRGPVDGPELGRWL